MPEVYNKKYSPIGNATFGYKLFREGLIPATDLAVNVAFVSNELTCNFTGYARQAFKIIPVHAGGGAPTVEVEIQEFLPDLGEPNDGDPAHGTWATKSGLGVGIAAINALFEHNQEDTMRLTRLRLTPKTAVSDGGIKYEISGRIDT